MANRESSTPSAIAVSNHVLTDKAKCTKCKIDKVISEFTLDRSRLSGLQCHCKECHKQSIKHGFLATWDIDPTQKLWCNQCQSWKKARDFHRNSTRPSGHADRCKQCVKINSAQHYEKNRKKILEEKKIYHKKNSQHIKAYNKERGNLPSFREARKIYSKIYGETHRLEISLNKKAYGKKNKETIRAKNQSRRIRIRNGIVESFSDIEIFERDQWVCQICFKKVSKHLKARHPLSPSIDHIIPVADGGDHTRRNTVLAHLKCNIVKGRRRVTQQQRLF